MISFRFGSYKQTRADIVILVITIFMNCLLLVGWQYVASIDNMWYGQFFIPKLPWSHALKCVRTGWLTSLLVKRVHVRGTFFLNILQYACRMRLSWSKWCLIRCKNLRVETIWVNFKPYQCVPSLARPYQCDPSNIKYDPLKGQLFHHKSKSSWLKEWGKLKEWENFTTITIISFKVVCKRIAIALYYPRYPISSRLSPLNWSVYSPYVYIWISIVFSRTVTSRRTVICGDISSCTTRELCWLVSW